MREESYKVFHNEKVIKNTKSATRAVVSIFSGGPEFLFFIFATEFSHRNNIY